MLQAIVFDFDGVIADSEPLHLRAAQAVLRAEGIELSERDYYERYLGYDDAGMLRAIAADRGLSLDEEKVAVFVARKSEVWESMAANGAVLFPGASECVRRCAAHVPLAIASGALGHEIELILARAGLLDCFSAIVSATDTLRGKPAPDPYLQAVASLQGTVRSGNNAAPVAARNCVAIEDSHWGLEAARAAGLRCVAITHTYPADQLGGADLIVERLEEVTIALLESLCPEVRG